MTRTVSTRLIDARELCEHNITQAAWLLGVSASQLRKYETGHGTDGEPMEIPSWLILKAGLVYAVSCDFLLGASENFERSPDACKDRDLLAMLNVIHFNESRRVAKLVFHQDGRLQAVEKAVGNLPPAIREIKSILDRFIELNPVFNDMPGGASLVDRVNQASIAAHQANCLLVRHKCIPKERLYKIEPDPIHKLDPPETSKTTSKRQRKIQDLLNDFD